MGHTEITGYHFNIGDKVKINIPVIEAGDLDGIAFTTNGKDYWRYINKHPDEVYTVTALDHSDDNEVSYCLDGYLEDNNWFANELIRVPAPDSRYEEIKNMSLDEMAAGLIPMVTEILERDMLTEDALKAFLLEKPYQSDTTKQREA